MMSTRNEDSRMGNHHDNNNNIDYNHQFRPPSNDDNDDDDDVLWARLVGDRDHWIHPSVRTSLLVLDRAFVEQLLRLHEFQHHHQPSTQPRSAPHRLVRHFGMVQDMMEPEYYTNHHHPNDRHGSLNLAERQPLLVVPLPFGRHFQSHYRQQRRRRLGGQDTTNGENENHLPTIVIPESPPTATTTTSSSTMHYPRKRERDDGTEAIGMDNEDDNHEPTDPLLSPATRRRRRRRRRDSKVQHFTGNDEENNNNNNHDDDDDEDSRMILGPESDWWPMGCMDSDPQEIAVMAKLYYDEYPEQEPLQLNDIVECVGMVSSSTSSSTMEDDDHDMDYGCGSMVGEEDVFGSFIPPRPPPASRLPRLHVLYFRKLTLEELANEHNDEEHHHHNEDVPMDIAIEDPIHIWTNALGLTGVDVTVWQALFLTLVSQAERTQGRMVRVPPPAQHALGCVSLQLQMPPTTSTTSTTTTRGEESTAHALYEQLLAFLRTTCPLVASVDLIQSTTSTTLIQGPGKETGRLFPNPWQLPKGSTIVIRYDGNYHNIHGDDSDDNNSGHTSNTNTLLLDELLRQHSISYSFEGGMKIPFDADYRIIVVTNAGVRLPCTLCCTMRDAINNNNNANDRFHFDQRQLESLKQALSRARSVGNITLPRIVLEQAQHDFVTRRERGREGPGQQNQHHLPNEEDFHRWLTLTRLFTRARGSAEATMTDWQSALELDDNIRAQQ